MRNKMKTFKEFLSEGLSPSLPVSKFMKMRDRDGKTVDSKKFNSNHFYHENPMLFVDWKYHILAGDLMDAIDVVDRLDNANLTKIQNDFIKSNNKFNKDDRFKWNPESYNELLKLVRAEMPEFVKSLKPVKYTIEELRAQKAQTDTQSTNVDSLIKDFFK